MSCHITSAGASFTFEEITSDQQKKNAIYIANHMINNASLTKVQAAAICGICMSESRCNPMSTNEKEKKTLPEGAYGAGITQWTHVDTKNKALTNAGFTAGTRIETLSLESQCKMLVGDSTKRLKTQYDTLKMCMTIEDATATAYCFTGGPYWSEYKRKWGKEKLTERDALACAKHYGSNNGKPFYERLNYATQILKWLQ